MASPVPSEVETAEEKAKREKLVAAVAAVVAAAVVMEANRAGVRAIAAPASVSVDAITAALVRALTLGSAVVHRAVHRYARVLVTDNDPAPTDESLVASLTDIESEYQIEYARKAAERVARKVFNAMSQESQRQHKRWDPDTDEGREGIARAVRAAYTDAVERATKHEAYLFDLRMEGVRQRVTETVEQMRVQRDSPEGAYWLLDPSRKTHTAGCVAMANKAWSWSVLSVINPAMMHYGCGCKIIPLSLAAAGSYPGFDRILTSAPKVARDELIG